MAVARNIVGMILVHISATVLMVLSWMKMDSLAFVSQFCFVSFITIICLLNKDMSLL